MAEEITGFRKHAAQRAFERGVPVDDLIDTVKNPAVVLQQSAGKYLFLSSRAIIVLNPAGEVVTVYPSSMFDQGIFNLMDAVGIAP
jgi:hypothetical protein